MKWIPKVLPWRSNLLLGILAASATILGQKAAMTSKEIDALWDIDDPVAGYAALTKALANHPGSADEIHTQIARALGLQRKFEEGWVELKRVSSHPSAIVKVRVELESGRLKNSSGDKQAAKPHFEKALDLALKGHFDYNAVDAAHMLGIVTNGEESIDWNNRAIALAAQSHDTRAQGWRGTLLNNIGWTYHNMGQFPEALSKFKEAVAYQEKLGDEKRTRIARWTVARCLRSLKRYEEAIGILEELVKFPEAGYVSEELGEDLLAVGKPEAAKPHFLRAYELLSKDPYLVKNEPKRLERLKDLGNEKQD